MRRMLVLVVALAAAGASAQPQLSLGREYPTGAVALGEWPHSGYDDAVAMATNGDEILVVTSAVGSLFGLRLDRHGRPIDSAAQPLVRVSSDFMVDFDPRLHAFWHRGTYVIFLRERSEGLYALRVTQDLEVVGRTSILESPGKRIDVTMDGDDFVVVDDTGQLLRLAGDFSVRQSFPRTTLNYAAHGVASGNGRVLILSGSYRLAARFLDGTTLGQRRELATMASGFDEASVEVTWTGSEFAATIGECDDESCLVSRARIAADGTLIEFRPIAYHRIDLGTAIPVAVVALDDETVLHLWSETGTAGWPVRGRRFRRGVALDETPLDFGRLDVAALRTPHDLLVTVDTILSVSATPAPAVTALASPVARTSAVAVSENEELLDAAASATRIAILSLRWRHDGKRRMVAAILRRDGTPLHEIELEGYSGVLGTDGQRLYAVTVAQGKVWFSELREGAPRVHVGIPYDRPGIVWNGSEFLVYRLNGPDSTLRARRVGRDGTLLGDVFTIPGAKSYATSIVRSGDELLLSGVDEGAYARGLSREGVPLEAPHTFPGPFIYPRAASNRRTDALLFTETVTGLNHRLHAAFRAPGGPWMLNADTLPQPRLTRMPSLVAAGGSFLALFVSYADNRRPLQTRVVLFDERGFHDQETLVIDDGVDDTPTALVVLNRWHVLAVYARTVFDPPHAGSKRVFARMLTVNAF